MPSRPDIRELARNVRDAFADADRETLLEVLTFVVKEYVVEGPPPMLIHQAETLADLQGMSFAQLVTALQTRTDHPELAMFVIDGEQVGVRIGGVVHPLLPGRTQMIDTRPHAAPAQPGVRVVETTLAQRPAPAAAPQPPRPAGQAPPPARGLSVRGRPNEGEAPAQPAAQPAPASPTPAPAAANPAAPTAAPTSPGSDKPEGGGDDASARFSLLELD
jgi:hypothetical protein